MNRIDIGSNISKSYSLTENKQAKQACRSLKTNVNSNKGKTHLKI